VMVVATAALARGAAADLPDPLRQGPRPGVV
jgi:hypothetical protein